MIELIPFFTVPQIDIGKFGRVSANTEKLIAIKIKISQTIIFLFIGIIY